MAADMPFFITDGRRQNKGDRDNSEPVEGGRRGREKVGNEDGQKGTDPK